MVETSHPQNICVFFFPGKSRIPTSALHKFQRSEFRPLLTTTLTEISERKQLQKKSPHCFWTKNSSMAKSLNPNCVSRNTNQTIKKSINQFKLRHFTAQGRVFFSNEGIYMNFLPATLFVVAFQGFFMGDGEVFATYPSLVGGWTNPSEKYARQIGSFPQGSGWKFQNSLKPPPRSAHEIPSIRPNLWEDHQRSIADFPIFNLKVSEAVFSRHLWGLWEIRSPQVSENHEINKPFPWRIHGTTGMFT